MTKKRTIRKHRTVEFVAAQYICARTMPLGVTAQNTVNALFFDMTTDQKNKTIDYADMYCLELDESSISEDRAI